ncbi:MAG: hypothetical protein V1872_05080 [bacterium]
MGLENVASDVAAHLGAGLFVAAVDYFTSTRTRSKNERIEERKRCLGSIDYILDLNTMSLNSEQNGVRRLTIEGDSVEYAQHIETARDYLLRSGKLKIELPLFEKIKYFLKGLIHEEKINNLEWRQKAMFALVIEVFYDSFIGIGYYMHVLKMSPIGELSRNIWQIPAFYIGLEVGNFIKKPIDWLIKTKDERTLEKTIDKLAKETDIVRFILEYQPSEDIRKKLKERGVKFYTSSLTRAGIKAYKHLKGLAGSALLVSDRVVHYREVNQQKKLEEKESLKKRFDEITKGY